MNRLIIVGSPRVDGRSAHLADLLFETCIEECPDDEVALAPVSTLDIGPCTGCDACRALVAKRVDAMIAAGSEAEACELPSRCVIDDDMAEVYELLDAADELIVVAPVYFAGPPSQLTALLDRLQPYFWTDARREAKRPATLHVIGEGGDPHGFDPLVGIVRSALSCAGFGLGRVLDWVGKIDEHGEIVAEAVEYPVPALPGAARAGKVSAGLAERDGCAVEPEQDVGLPANIVKPKFSLSQENAKVRQPVGNESASQKSGGAASLGSGPGRKGGNAAGRSGGPARKGSSSRKGAAPGNKGGKRRG
ncbi:MAG: flavodoxin family protein [Gordonibacter sp.]